MSRDLNSLNRVILVGRVGQAPETRVLPQRQSKVVRFSLATNERSFNPNTRETKDYTEWHKIVVWGKQAEICNQYLKKGSRVLIEGRLTPDKASGGPRIWQKQDGTSAASFEVTAQTVRFLTTRGENEAGGPGGDAGDMAVAPAEDDIPF